MKQNRLIRIKLDKYINLGFNFFIIGIWHVIPGEICFFQRRNIYKVKIEYKESVKNKYKIYFLGLNKRSIKEVKEKTIERLMIDGFMAK